MHNPLYSKQATYKAEHRFSCRGHFCPNGKDLLHPVYKQPYFQSGRVLRICGHPEAPCFIDVLHWPFKMFEWPGPLGVCRGDL